MQKLKDWLGVAAPLASYITMVAVLHLAARPRNSHEGLKKSALEMDHAV